jgi:4-alpha-glucanotransferase
MFGDIPIFVAYDSADVWAKPQLFKLDKTKKMQVVAGVPPDYFRLQVSVGVTHITIGKPCRCMGLVGGWRVCARKARCSICCVLTISVA